MLRNVRNLLGFGIRATDGVIGTVDDLYFDDQDWTIRYFVVNTGSWLTGRKVLVSPIAISSPAWITRVLPAALTKAQVEHSPDIDTRKPVSRQNETEYLGYYGYSHYWGGSGVWGLGAYPGSLTTDGRMEERVKGHRTPETPEPDDYHLRSSNAVIGSSHRGNGWQHRSCRGPGPRRSTRGQFAILLWTRATGGAVNVCSSRHDGSKT